MISRYFGSKTQEFPVPDDEVPLRLLLFHACRPKFCYTPHYKPEKYHRYCQISLLFASSYHPFSFPMYLFRHQNKKSFLRFLRDGYFNPLSSTDSDKEPLPYLLLARTPLL